MPDLGADPPLPEAARLDAAGQLAFLGADPPVPEAAHLDAAGQLAFLDRHLLGAARGFVRQGGGKLKLVLGGTGAGKTHFVEALLAAAGREGFLTARVDARARPLWGADLLYQAIAADLDFEALGLAFAGRVLSEAGYPGAGPAAGQGLAAWAAAGGHEAVAVRARLDDELHRRLLSNSDLDYGYALGLARWCEALLGLGAPDEGGLLEHWLRGGKVAVRDCNRLRLRRSADRQTARLWLRSLLRFVREAGASGLAVGVDGLEAVLERKAPALPEGAAGQPAAPSPHYTKGRRDDLYETLRALIDDMGLLPGLLLCLAGPPELVSDGRVGFGSYPALADRVKSEVDTVEYNRFADAIALERLWAADPDAGRALAERLLAAVAPGAGADLRQRALAAARAQWTARDVTVSAVRRSVLAVLDLTGASGAREHGEAAGHGV